MISGNNRMPDTKRQTGQKARWNKASRCSICTNVIRFQPIVLKDPIEAPEPRRKWVLCKSCHEALLEEMRRSSLSIHSPNRLRVAMGLVAAERSPEAYSINVRVREQQIFQREFVWGIRLIILFALLHAVILVIVLTATR